MECLGQPHRDPAPVIRTGDESKQSTATKCLVKHSHLFEDTHQ